PGDSIPAKIEHGLEHSCVLVLCMSSHAFGSEWTQLESNTFRFRDPLNKSRRFVPLRLDTTPIKGSIAQFLYIDWLSTDRDLEYLKLLEACRPTSGKRVAGVTARDVQFEEKQIKLDFQIDSHAFAFSPNRKQVLIAGPNATLELWDLEARRCIKTFKGHMQQIESLTWCDTRCFAISGSADTTLRLWNIEEGRCLKVLRGHRDSVTKVAISGDGNLALSAGNEGQLCSWVLNTSEFKSFETSQYAHGCVAISSTKLLAVTSQCGALKLWDMETGKCLREFFGHSNVVNSAIFSDNEKFIVSGSSDTTVRLWDVKSGRLP
ncbi:MAG: TIR domain-containing protein, partial [Candidatus Competibacteraceae bacterium]|nr:TIR domain-containing protein [Candidatus Competibacteraceae bacterium]